MVVLVPIIADRPGPHSEDVYEDFQPLGLFLRELLAILHQAPGAVQAVKNVSTGCQELDMFRARLRAAGYRLVPGLGRNGCHSQIDF